MRFRQIIAEDDMAQAPKPKLPVAKPPSAVKARQPTQKAQKKYTANGERLIAAARAAKLNHGENLSHLSIEEILDKLCT